MFCKNCGAKLPDDANVCPECSNAVSGGESVTNNVTNQTSAIDTNVHTVNGTPKRKSPLKFILLLIVAVLGISAVAYAAPKVVKKIRMASMSPEERYRYIEENNIDEHLEKLMTGYDIVTKEMKKDNFGTHQTVKLELSDTAKSLLSMSGVNFSNLKTIEIDLDSNINKESIGYKAVLVSEDEELITANIIMDAKAGDMFIQIPEISESYIRIPAEQMGDSSEISESLNSMSDIGNKLPSGKEIIEITDVCTETFLDNVNNISENKEAEISAEGITEKVTDYVVTLDEKEAQACIKAVADELKDNKTLKTVITRFDEKAYTSFTDAVNDIDFSSESDSSGEIDALRMTVSVNGSETIVGRNIETLDADGNVTLVMSYCIPSNGNEFGFNFTLKDESSTAVEIIGTGNIKSEILNGTFSVKSEEAVENSNSELATIKVEDYDYSEAAKSKSNGKISVSLSDAIPQTAGYSIAYEFDVDGLESSQTINIMAGKDKFASIILDSKVSSKYEAKLPGDSETVIDSDDSDALASYVDETKVQSVITNVFTKLGLDESVINSLFAGGMNSESSYDYE